MKYKKETDGESKSVPLLRTGIAWESDKNYKFKNPDTGGKTLQKCKISLVFDHLWAFVNLYLLLDLEGKVAKPKDWSKNLWELDTEIEGNNGLQNEDLIVWMRTAAFPNFRKLYRRINHTDTFSEGLPAGTYTLKIDYSESKLSHFFRIFFSSFHSF